MLTENEIQGLEIDIQHDRRYVRVRLITPLSGVVVETGYGILKRTQHDPERIKLCLEHEVRNHYRAVAKQVNAELAASKAAEELVRMAAPV